MRRSTSKRPAWLNAALEEPGASLLALRAFLGVTFVFAGLRNLASSSFFSASAPGSLQQQLRDAVATSPLHHLLDVALHAPTLVAVAVSAGELAVGIGTLLGLFARVAAIGGVLLSLAFFLTVSFNDNPYYYGAGIVFLFAWTPFALSGPSPLSLDHLYARRVARARTGLQLGAARGGPALQRRRAEIERRVLIQHVSTVGIVAFSTVVLGGAVAAIGRLLRSAQPSTAIGIGDGSLVSAQALDSTGSATTTTAPRAQGSAPRRAAPKGTPIGPASDVPVGGAASFTDPAQGTPALVVQLRRGTFRAFSAICPHAGCPVVFDQQDDIFVCPCHGSRFDIATGAVEQGPASTGLSPIPVAIGPGGELYADG